MSARCQGKGAGTTMSLLHLGVVVLVVAVLYGWLSERRRSKAHSSSLIKIGLGGGSVAFMLLALFGVAIGVEPFRLWIRLLDLFLGIVALTFVFAAGAWVGGMIAWPPKRSAAAGPAPGRPGS